MNNKQNRSALLKLIWAVSSLVLLSSCSTTKYYYPTLDSRDMSKTKTGVFNNESDSFAVAYSFMGENAPLKITVKNKMSDSLRVNWSESWLKVGNNQERTTLVNPVKNQEMESVVAPKKQVEETFFQSGALNIDPTLMDRTDKKFSKQNISVGDTLYTLENSPLVLTCHLTLYVGSLGEEPIVLENKFFLSGVRESGFRQKAPMLAYQRGDVFYIRQTSGLQKSSIADGGSKVLNNVIVPMVGYVVLDMIDLAIDRLLDKALQ